MRSPKQALHALKAQYRRRRTALPWAELEAEAARQGCSPADIFFDRAGRQAGRVPTMPGAEEASPTSASSPAQRFPVKARSRAR